MLFNDLFFLLKEAKVCKYADDTTIYMCGHEFEQIVSSLSNWFVDNKMKLTPDKCHLILGGGGADISANNGETINTESV